MRNLSQKELKEINGGDEPAYALGYYLGKVASWAKDQLNGIGERATNHSSLVN